MVAAEDSTFTLLSHSPVQKTNYVALGSYLLEEGVLTLGSAAWRWNLFDRRDSAIREYSNSYAAVVGRWVALLTASYRVCALDIALMRVPPSLLEWSQPQGNDMIDTSIKTA